MPDNICNRSDSRPLHNACAAAAWWMLYSWDLRTFLGEQVPKLFVKMLVFQVFFYLKKKSSHMVFAFLRINWWITFG